MGVQFKNILHGSFIFLNWKAATNPDLISTISHEVGHYFELHHTHQNNDKGFCRKEPVDREREYPFFNTCISSWFSGKKICEVAGDGLGDTPADPSLLSNSGCTYTGTGVYSNITDTWGDIYWRSVPTSRYPLPDATNIMSYNSTRPCLEKFSRL